MPAAGDGGGSGTAPSELSFSTRPDGLRSAGNRSEAHTVKRGSAQAPLAVRPVPAAPTSRPMTEVIVVAGVDNTL